MPVAVVALAAAAFAEPASTARAAAGYTFAVNSTTFTSAADKTPGDGICATSAGVCTLRAALEEANALKGNALITVADGFSGTIAPGSSGCTSANFMYTSSLGSGATSGAYFMISAPNITIDLKNSLSLSDVADCATAGIYVNGANAAIRNVKDFYTGANSFQVGSGGTGATFFHLTLDPAPNWNPERAVVLNDGANNVTVSSSTLYGLGQPYKPFLQGTVMVTAGATVSNLTVVGNTFTNTVGATTCDGTGGTGCRNNAISVDSGGNVNTLTVANNNFDNFDWLVSSWGGTVMPIRLSGATTISNLDVNGNQFRAEATGSGSSRATIILPTNQALGGTNTIRNNRFIADTSSSNRSVVAIYWDSNLAATADSHLTISDNFFDGYGATSSDTSDAVIQLDTVGIVPVQHNIFGPKTYAPYNAANGETTTNRVLLANSSSSSNHQVATWYPTAATVSGCSLSVTVAYPTSGTTLPAAGATLDFFYNSSASSSANLQGAEVYLGSASVAAGVTTAQTFSFGFTSAAGGNVRLQTQALVAAGGSQVMSSQYSRVIAVGATSGCGPAVKLNQAPGQDDPTYVRALHYVLTSSEALAAAPAASAFSTSASSCSSVTVDAVTKVSDTVYDVSAHANQTCTVVLSLPAGKLTDTKGTASTASTSSDNTVAYTSPLSRSGDVTAYGALAGKAITFTRADALPATDAISVAASLASTTWAGITASVTVPSVAGSAAATVTAVADQANASHATTASFAVSSPDPNFNGLLLASVAVTSEPVATIAPTSGLSKGGATVTLTQLYAGASVAAVSFGATAGTGLTGSCTGSGTTCTVTTPAHTAATVDVVVTLYDTSAGTSTPVTLPGVFTFYPTPAMTITKAAYSDEAHTTALANGSVLTSGTKVYWVYTVKNTGETALVTISVVDDQLAAGAVSCDAATLAAGASTTCRASGTVS